MTDLTSRMLHALARPSDTPVKPKVLARRMGVPDEQYPEFRKTLRALVRDARIEVGHDHTLRVVDPFGTVVGTYRRLASGNGFVRPNPAADGTPGPDIFIREDKARDASIADAVVVRITRTATQARDAAGRIVHVMRSATPPSVRP